MDTIKFYNSVKEGKVNDMLKEFQSILAQIPFEQFGLDNMKNAISLSMGLICKMTGIRYQSCMSVAGGDIDMVIETKNYVYVIQFVEDHSPVEALKEIESKGFALPWLTDRRKVYKVGIESSSAKRNIIDWIIDPQPEE